MVYIGVGGGKLAVSIIYTKFIQMKRVLFLIGFLNIVNLAMTQSSVIGVQNKLFHVFPEGSGGLLLPCLPFGPDYGGYSVGIHGYSVHVADIGFLPGENGSSEMILAIYHGEDYSPENLVGVSNVLDQFYFDPVSNTYRQDVIVELFSNSYDILQIPKTCGINHEIYVQNPLNEIDFEIPLIVTLVQFSDAEGFELYEDFWGFFTSEIFEDDSEFLDDSFAVCCDGLRMESDPQPIGGNSLQNNFSQIFFVEQNILPDSEGSLLEERRNPDLFKLNSCLISPNPFNSFITISGDGFKNRFSILEIKILDNLGRTRKAVQVRANELQNYRLDLGELLNGVYYIVFTGEGLFQSERIIKI